MEFSLANETPGSRVRQWIEQVKIHLHGIDVCDSISYCSEEAIRTFSPRKRLIKPSLPIIINHSPHISRRNECGKARLSKQLVCGSEGRNTSDSCLLISSCAFRKPYELTEELAVINFIVDRNLFLNLKGNVLWKEMENLKICDRSWQSMKSHFLKSILPNIDQFSLSKSTVAKFIHSMEARYCTVGLPHQPGKSKRFNYYTPDEDDDILKYILSSERYKKTRGNKIWIEMVKENVVPNRSWQSLKSRFFTILPHLSRYLLQDEEIHKLNYVVRIVNTSEKSYPPKISSKKCHSPSDSVNHKALSSVSTSVPKGKVDYKLKRQIRLRALMTGKVLAAKLKQGKSSFK